MDPSPHFISFKKFHLYSCSFDQSPFFILLIFHFKFYFLDSFPISAAVSGDLQTLSVHLGKNWQHASSSISATHTTVTGYTARL